jgi:putative FmdB family regulatory protein
VVGIRVSLTNSLLTKPSFTSSGSYPRYYLRAEWKVCANLNSFLFVQKRGFKSHTVHVQRWMMALYEYYCKKCDNVVDVSHPMTDTPEIICFECHVPRTKKLGLAGAIFKGSGWGKDR